MAKNLISEICKMLGVELGEEFNVVSKDGSERICTLCHDGLLDNTNYVYYDKELFVDIVCGKLEIIKLPWKPKKGDRYYTFNNTAGDNKLCVTFEYWSDAFGDFALLKTGWVYRTHEEAEAALPKVAKEIGVEYEL